MKQQIKRQMLSSQGNESEKYVNAPEQKDIFELSNGIAVVLYN
jgi:hypothetical protein